MIGCFGFDGACHILGLGIDDLQFAVNLLRVQKKWSSKLLVGGKMNV
jgi:hypothetical protein